MKAAGEGASSLAAYFSGARGCGGNTEQRKSDCAVEENYVLCSRGKSSISLSLLWDLGTLVNISLVDKALISRRSRWLPEVSIYFETA